MGWDDLMGFHGISWDFIAKMVISWDVMGFR
jgi:hypothetical protein